MQIDDSSDFPTELLRIFLGDFPAARHVWLLEGFVEGTAESAILEFPMADDSLSATLLPEGSCVIRNCADLGATLSHWPENQRELRNCPQPLAPCSPPKSIQENQSPDSWDTPQLHVPVPYRRSVLNGRPRNCQNEGMAVATHSWSLAIGDGCRVYHIGKPSNLKICKANGWAYPTICVKFCHIWQRYRWVIPFSETARSHP